jgi:hypothetical protein
VESYDIAKSDETLQLATDVARFIRENKLFLNMQGKEYVNVEGWQYAGSRLGILPIVEELTNLSDGQEVKYQSRVRLLNLRNEQIVGSGFAICSNKEPGKKFFQEFAIASMAQTRAIGKAYRNILAWLIRAAGYEPTPAEEMEYGQNPAGNQEGQDRRESAPAPRVKAEARPGNGRRPGCRGAGRPHAADGYYPSEGRNPAAAQQRRGHQGGEGEDDRQHQQAGPRAGRQGD